MPIITTSADFVGLTRTHPYLCFAPTANTATMAQNIMTPCQQWSQGYNTSMQAFGFSFAGEWSLAVNDCGRFVNGVGLGTRQEGTYPTPATTTTNYVSSCAYVSVPCLSIGRSRG